MKKVYKDFKDEAYVALRKLAKENPIFDDARMIVASSEAQATLQRNKISKSIDTDWVEAIEKALPSLDVIIRNPRIAIEDVDEVLPVELSRHINDKSVKHLATHTNLILDIKGDDVVPQKILNVYHDETYLTYENKFINTLLARLSAFVDKRYKVLVDGNGIERKFKFNYQTEIEHNVSDDGGRNIAQITLGIELTSPFNAKKSDANSKINQNYQDLVGRIGKIYNAILGYQSTEFIQKLGHNYVRPPVIRTNAILKNKDFKECLALWEFIESYEKIGYSKTVGKTFEMPSHEYISDLHSAIALQYIMFYNGVTESKDNRMLSKKNMFEIDPEFAKDDKELRIDDYRVYDSEYRKVAPVSRIINDKKKLSEDEKKILDAINISLRADEKLKRIRLQEERERKRKLEEERKRLEALRKEKERQEAEAKRIEEEKIRELKRQDIFFPEDGDLTDRAPLCIYTRKEYNEMGPILKRQVKLKMQKVADYSKLQKQLAKIKKEHGSIEKILKIEERCEKIIKKLPFDEGWDIVLRCHEC